jgi:hypothetical protein
VGRQRSMYDMGAHGVGQYDKRMADRQSSDNCLFGDKRWLRCCKECSSGAGERRGAHRKKAYGASCRKATEDQTVEVKRP